MLAKMRSFLRSVRHEGRKLYDLSSLVARHGLLVARYGLTAPWSTLTRLVRFLRARPGYDSEGKVSDTFCILPWKHLHITSDGLPHVCCAFDGFLSRDDGSPMSVYKDTLEGIWNSEEMRSVRRDMVEGKKITACEFCYKAERAGGCSKRMNETRSWEGGWLNDELVTLGTLKLQSVLSDHHLETMPVSYQLDVGNLCNLKCRMCFGTYSSRIRRDAVHGKWADEPERQVEVLGSRFPGNRPWFQEQDFILKELCRNPEQIKDLYFLGGEPFLIKEVGDILKHLVDAGVARNVRLRFSTNGTTVKPRWIELATEFKCVNLCISIDGFGKYYEYIRYPAKWDKLISNIEVLRRLFPHGRVTASSTLQAYNALNIVDLFRYLDSIGMQFQCYIITSPRHLCPPVMPPKARRLAAERLRSYAASDCRPEKREMVLALARELDSTGDKFDLELMRDFMLFTNDLDSSRGQSFREVHPEHLELITDTGFEWTSKTLHASRGVASLSLVSRNDP